MEGPLPTLQYRSASDTTTPVGPAGGVLLKVALWLCLPLLVLAWWAGWHRNVPGRMGVLGSIYLLFLGAPLFLAAAVCWSRGFWYARRTWDLWQAERRRIVTLIALPPILGLLGLGLSRGVISPGPPAVPGIASLASASSTWNTSADDFRKSDSGSYKPLVIDGVPVEWVELDPSGGVWFITRQRDAGGFFWSWFYEGIVYRPTAGHDPGGNRGGPTLKPLGNGWYEFRTLLVD